MSEYDVEAIRDEVEELTFTLPRDQVAEGLEEEAARHEVGRPPRAELLATASSDWLRRGNHADAIRCADAAVADGGPTWMDPRVQLVDALLATGSGRADEVITGLRRTLRTSSNRDVGIELVADDLHAAGRYREAARWYTLLLGDLDPPELVEGHALLGALGALGRRRQARLAAGLGTDAFDQVAATRARTPYGEWAFRPATALAWPDDELAALLARWPDLYVEVGRSPAEHRDLVRAALDDFEPFERGGRAHLAWGSVVELVAHSSARGTDPRHHASRRAYTAMLAAEGRAQIWRRGAELVPPQ